MEDVFNYIQSHWESLVVVLSTVLALFIGIFRKKVKIVIPECIIDSIYENIPGWIIDAEQSDRKGSSKLNYVCNTIAEYLHQTLGVSISAAKGYAFGVFADYIEKVLSTPTKKGITYEKKTLEKGK